MLSKLHKKTLENKIVEAKKNKEKLNDLILQFKPFIASIIQKKVGRYMEYGRDDELSIGLMAFNEAVFSFDNARGKFLSFARIVITNRLIDYYRKQSKNKEILLSSNENDDPLIELIDKKSFEKYTLREKDDEIKLEVIEYIKSLKDWKISFTQLLKACPKHERLRSEYKRIARIIVENQHMLDELKKKKRLPIKYIEKVTSIHRKKIERGRIYIIALVLAILKDCSFFKL